MRPEDYPRQEPFAERAAAYHAEVMRRGEGVAAEEHSYGPDPYQGIAVFRPARPGGYVLAFLHGGGWTNGYKEWLAFMAPGLTAAGVTFASVGYRLAPAHVFPAGFTDCALAVAWLHRHAAGDFFIGGHSAGGHYAALLAVRRDWQAALGLPRDAIAGCLPISGVYDFTPGCGLGIRPRFLGREGNERPASPLHNIQGTPPPFLIAHGSADFPHLITQAAKTQTALTAAGGDVERLVLEGCDHFTASYAAGDPAGPWLGHALAWMEARATNRTQTIQRGRIPHA